jgi:hypothetical protein
VESVVKLRLFIDTDVWLNLAKDYRQLPTIDALTYIWEANELELIVPRIVVDEFQRNKERVVAEVRQGLSTHFRLVRQAIAQFASDNEQRDATIRELHEIDHKISLGDGAINNALEQIEKLHAEADKVEPSESVKARAADRALAKLAPCHRQRNSMADAVLLETYVAALAAREDEDDWYGFVTHNVNDFSAPGADNRLPHPDIAPLFDGKGSRYSTNLAALLSDYAGGLMEEIRFEREFSEEPRKLSELLEAEQKLFWQVWYNRKWGLIGRFEKGELKLVSQADWEQAKPEQRHGMVVESIWQGMLDSMKHAEELLGPDDIGPWDDFEWGVINGKLSALRWVMGDEWDMLDT